ncbi:MAG: hypothetical protein AAF798_21685, partial [Bacteroidota bacterium]
MVHFGEPNRLIYQYGMPQYPHCIDLYSLLPASQTTIRSWLPRLLQKKPISFALETTFSQTKALQHCYYDHQNQLSHFGHHLFRIGFPILGCTLDEELWVAPLLIWQMKLQAPTPEQGHWVINSMEQLVPTLNPVLAEALQRHLGIDLYPLYDDLLKANDPERAFQQLLQALTPLLGHKPDLPDAWEPLPAGEQLEQLHQQSKLLGAAICGLFPPAKRSFSSDSLAKALQPQPLPSSGHKYGLFKLDPHQTSAFHHWRQQKVTVVQGDSGTGKTQLAAQVISNGLSNGKSCIVVANNLATLKYIQAQLSKFGLTQLHFLLQDTPADRQLFFELLRTASNSDTNLLQHNENRFEQLKNKLDRASQQLDAPYQASR